MDREVALQKARDALVQAKGALLLDAMIDGAGNFFGTTTEALEAIDETLAEIAVITPAVASDDK